MSRANIIEFIKNLIFSNRIPLVNKTSVQFNAICPSSSLNTFNKEAACEGKMRTYYDVQTQKPRENNLHLFSLAYSKTPREQLTELVSTVNIKLHGLTGFNCSIIIRVRYYTHTYKEKWPHCSPKETKMGPGISTSKRMSNMACENPQSKTLFFPLLPHLLNGKINCRNNAAKLQLVQDFRSDWNEKDATIVRS